MTNDPTATQPVATFSVALTRHVDEAGACVGALPEWARSHDTLIALLRGMVLTRLFDEKAVALQRTGRLGTYASSLGQEAVSVGVASAMRSDDVFLPSFREQGGMLWRGVEMTELLAYWGGNETGSNFAGPREDFPICVPVGTQFPHAVGVALAFQMRSQPRVAVTIGGDGATSKGDFYEAMNVAGVWRLPVVFVVSNNQWAISVPRSAQTGAETLAQKAIAAGFPGLQVDGNDVVAVREVTARALERARAGEGATLIEALTYRLSDHTTADDARRYREETEVSRHWKADPIARLRTYLGAQGAWDKEKERTLTMDCRSEVEAAAEAYLASPRPAPGEMFDHLYASLPPALADQRTALLEDAGGRDA